MSERTSDPNENRRRRTESLTQVDKAVASLSKRLADLAQRLENLKTDDPAAAQLANDLDRVAVILDRVQGISLCRQWTQRLAAAILRSPSLLNATNSPQLRKVGAWATRVAKEASVDQRTVAARAAKEAVRVLAAQSKLGSQAGEA